MTTRYADFDLASGDNDGTSWANAWRTFAEIMSDATVVAGDTVLCRGTTTEACVNTLSGDETNGLIKWIGVDASGNNVGGTTRCIIDAATANQVPLTQTGNYNLYENFAFCNSGNNAGVSGAGDDNVYVNCAIYDNNGAGYYGSGMSRVFFIRCVSYSNGGNGFSTNGGAVLIFCCSRDSTGDGFTLTTYDRCIGCIAYDNGDTGFDNVYQGLLFNCVSNLNTDDGVRLRSGATSYISAVIGCRITNHSGAGDIGLNANTEICLYGWNYMENNADANVQNATLAYALTLNGATTNIEDQANTNQGYTDDDPEDFNLRTDASLRRNAITIPTS